MVPCASLQALKKICWYIVLAPHSVEQQTLLHTIAGEKRLAELVQYHSLIKQFTTMEVWAPPTPQHLSCFVTNMKFSNIRQKQKLYKSLCSYSGPRT